MIRYTFSYTSEMYVRAEFGGNNLHDTLSPILYAYKDSSRFIDYCADELCTGARLRHAINWAPQLRSEQYFWSTCRKKKSDWSRKFIILTNHGNGWETPRGNMRFSYPHTHSYRMRLLTPSLPNYNYTCLFLYIVLLVFAFLFIYVYAQSV